MVADASPPGKAGMIEAAEETFTDASRVLIFDESDTVLHASFQVGAEWCWVGSLSAGDHCASQVATRHHLQQGQLGDASLVGDVGATALCVDWMPAWCGRWYRTGSNFVRIPCAPHSVLHRSCQRCAKPWQIVALLSGRALSSKGGDTK